MIKLLEIPAIQLEQRIKKELEENPVLEEGNDEGDFSDQEETKEEQAGDQLEEFSLEDYMQDDDIPSYRLNAQNYSVDEKREDIPFSLGSTFQELLKSQLGLRKLSDEQDLQPVDCPVPLTHSNNPKTKSAAPKPRNMFASTDRNRPMPTIRRGPNLSDKNPL